MELSQIAEKLSKISRSDAGTLNQKLNNISVTSRNLIQQYGPKAIDKIEDVVEALTLDDLKNVAGLLKNTYGDKVRIFRRIL